MTVASLSSGCLQRLHRLPELEEAGVAAVGPGVDRGRLRVGLALELLGRPVAHRARRQHVALLLAADLGGSPLALGAAALGDALSLRDHPLEDGLLHRVRVVEALEAHVHELDPELRGDLRRSLQDALGDLLPPGPDRGHRLGLADAAELARGGEVPVRGAHDLDEVERSDGVAGLAVHDVVEPALGRRARRAGPGRSAGRRRSASARRCPPRCTSCPGWGSRWGRRRTPASASRSGTGSG